MKGTGFSGMDVPNFGLVLDGANVAVGYYRTKKTT